MARSMIQLVAPFYTGHDRNTIEIFGNLGKFDDDGIVRAFEEEFAEYVGCAGGVAVNSGTNALIVALKATLDPTFNPMFQPVHMPSYSCRALLDAVFAVHAKPELVDNRCDISRAVFHSRDPVGAKLFVLPHMFGRSPKYVDYSPGWKVIEDITLSLGNEWARNIGIGVCSFHRDKIITTGRGGMIVSQDESFLERCRELAYYDQPRNGTYSPAFSFGMTAMQAALGRSQLRQLPSFIERRREIAARYTAVFREVGIETPDPDVDSVFFRYIIGVDDPAGKVEALGRRGVEVGRGVNPPLHRLLGLPNDQFRGAEECFRKLLSVPVHPGLTDEQVQYIIVQVLETCAP